MKKYDLFEIMGPIMIGPSSSHTAGAARLAKMARIIYNKEIKNLTFYLHGSFQTTYQGHGSDRALVGGILGFEPDDERIIDSMNIANSEGVKFDFKNIDLGYVHPNTIKIVFHEDDGNDFFVTGSSIGGGKIEIFNINGIKTKFMGESPTIVAEYNDTFGMIMKISQILTQNDISIATLNVIREENIAQMVMELDQDFTDKVVEEIKSINGMIHVIAIKAL